MVDRTRKAGTADWERWLGLTAREPTGRPRSEPEFQDFPPYQGAAGRAFQSFTRWLKNESFHQRGQYCQDDACRICASWRRIAQERATPCDYYGRCDDAAIERVWHGGQTGFRNYCRAHADHVQARVAQVRRNAYQDYGFDQGREIALDALSALALIHPPQAMPPETDGEKIALGHAIRQGFLTTVRRGLPPL